MPLQVWILVKTKESDHKSLQEPHLPEDVPVSYEEKSVHLH